MQEKVITAQDQRDKSGNDAADSLATKALTLFPCMKRQRKGMEERETLARRVQKLMRDISARAMKYPEVYTRTRKPQEAGDGQAQNNEEEDEQKEQKDDLSTEQGVWQLPDWNKEWKTRLWTQRVHEMWKTYLGGLRKQGGASGHSDGNSC